MKQASENFIKLPESELRLMQAVWALHAAGEPDITAAALMAADEGLARLKLTTVLTLITRLAGRGFLAIEKRGRANCYTPLVSEADYKAQAAAEFIASVYESRPGNLLSALVNGGLLSDEEIEELRAVLAQEAKGDRS
ncbi:MAG: BlaI/MecI/CopY family transcriptional regulator [Clostridia bacterium]|nr:BlaI/MecI/CopY family transcriptional regulator [Clostridia bacterium]